MVNSGFLPGLRMVEYHVQFETRGGTWVLFYYYSTAHEPSFAAAAIIPKKTQSCLRMCRYIAFPFFSV